MKNEVKIRFSNTETKEKQWIKVIVDDEVATIKISSTSPLSDEFSEGTPVERLQKMLFMVTAGSIGEILEEDEGED